MNFRHLFQYPSLFLLSILLVGLQACKPKLILYKKVDGVDLLLEIHAPPEALSQGQLPAMVFFFGGGWRRGDRSQFKHHAKYFAQRGMVCFLVDYRVGEKHGTAPFESLKDAKSAIRYIRKNADAFQIDPNRIVAAGGSAGGHLAAATALCLGFNETTEDSTVSCVPNALVLFNPVIDNGPNGYGYRRVGEAYEAFSPLHNIGKGAPPTLFMLGTEDALIPQSTAEEYRDKMTSVGAKCKVILYEDQAHGFFNHENSEMYQRTVIDADDFIQALGYINELPKVEPE